eukprot:1138204-Pelagomonas_calceolata.AAC.5
MLRLWSLHGVTSKGGCTAAATAAAAAPLPAASAAETGMHAPMGGIGSSRAWAYGQGGEAVRTYSGHTNERNFVGLSQAGNYIATGSETGEVEGHIQADVSPCLRGEALNNVLIKTKGVVVATWKSATRAHSGTKWSREGVQESSSATCLTRTPV